MENRQCNKGKRDENANSHVSFPPTPCISLNAGICACKQLKEFFRRNKDVTDVRVVDMLVAKGQLELEETHAIWKQKTHVMRYFEDPAGPKQAKDFMTKFLSGAD